MTYYDDFNNAEQKVALVWKTSVATLVYDIESITVAPFFRTTRSPTSVSARVGKT